MRAKLTFTKPVRLFGAALIATAVTTFAGIYGLRAEAQSQTCSLRDVSAWQLMLTDTQAEVTPRYILEVTEAFLKACPERPEFREASKVAAIAATDLGAHKVAIMHFENAGPLHDTQASFYYATALLNTGRVAAAQDVRDAMIANWLGELNATPEAVVEAQPISGGMLYTTRFVHAGDQGAGSLAMTAIPDVMGWPATLTVGMDRGMFSFKALRAGAFKQQSMNVDFYRCRGRRLLGRAGSTLPTDIVEQSARAALIGYLADPDGAKANDANYPCLWVDKLLPRPVS
ncbi:MAG: hypothetical protein Hens3KO_23910 [Henriciella sp.]